MNTGALWDEWYWKTHKQARIFYLLLEEYWQQEGHHKMRLGPTWAGVCLQGDELDRHQHRPTRIFHCADGKKICLKNKTIKKKQAIVVKNAKQKKNCVLLSRAEFTGSSQPENPPEIRKEQKICTLPGLWTLFFIENRLFLLLMTALYFSLI